MCVYRNEQVGLQYHRVERTMRRIRQTTMPAPPKKIEQIPELFQNPTVNNLYGRTKQKLNTEKNQFYRTTRICEEFAYSLFASQRIIDLIQDFPIEKRRFMMDATFKIVPKIFSQLLVIYFETPSKQVNLKFVFNQQFK